MTSHQYEDQFKPVSVKEVEMWDTERILNGLCSTFLCADHMVGMVLGAKKTSSEQNTYSHGAERTF